MATEKLTLKLDGKYTGKKAFDQAERDMDGLKRKADGLDASLTKGSAATSNKFKQLGASLGVFNKGLGSSVSKLGATSGALGGLTAMMGGPLVAAAAAAAAAIGTFAVMSYNAAKQSQAEWAKFKGVVEGAGQSFENSKKVVSDYATVSGRKVADVRTAFQQLTAAGINPSAEALRAVNELAIGLRGNMGDAATAYTRIVKGGQGAGRTLAKLGLTMEDISTGGKVDTAKLQAVLEQKFGKAADNLAKTAEAASNRFSDAWTRFQVKFGSLLLGPATALQNGMASLLDALGNFGGIVWQLFGGGEAFSGAMEYLTPALDELWKTIQEAIGPITGAGDQFGVLKPILTAFGISLSFTIKTITAFIKAILFIKGALTNTAKWITDAASYWSTQYKNSGAWIRGLGQRIHSLIMDAANYLRGAWNNTASFFRSAGQKIYNAVVNFPSWLWSTLQSALPKIQWPSLPQIGQWIRDMIWGSRGPGLGNISGQIAQQSALRTSNLAAQRQALANAYNSSPAAQSAASQATSNMGIFGLFRGPGDGWKSAISGMSFNYQDYAGSRQKAWNGGNCMTGNCVDMSLGVLNAAAAYGARGGKLVFGSWNGGPHVWAEVDGVTVDPARKALNNTFAAPARGPGNKSSVIIDMRGSTIYDGPKFEKAITNILNKHLG